MNFTTVNDKMNMSYEKYIKRPMQAVEMNLDMIDAKNPNLINSLERFHNLPVITKDSHIPFVNY